MERKEPSSGGKEVVQRHQAPSESSEETATNESCSGEEFLSVVVQESSPVLDASIVLEANPGLEPAAHSRIESSGVPNSGKIERPGPYDVLFGRGKPYQIHKGNRRFHKIVAAHKPRYLRSKQNQKCDIAKMVIKLVQQGNSAPVRFLRREGYFWVEVPNEVAREKVSHALRCKTKKADRSDVPSEDAISICPPFGPRSLMLGAAPLSTPAAAIYGNRLPLLSEQPKPYNAVPAPALVSAAICMPNSVSLPMASPPSWGGQANARRPGPTMGGLLGARLAAPESFILPRMLGVPYGIQMAMSRSGPRSGYTGTPVGMLSEDQILETLLQRRQARTFVPGRPQFFPSFS
jgi:hypothetical protein